MIVPEGFWNFLLQDFMEKWTGKDNDKSRFLRDSLCFSIADAKTSPRRGYRTCDGYAMAAVLDKGVVTKSQAVYATVELTGQLTRGQMVVDWTNLLEKEANISLIQGLDMVKVERLLGAMV
ncbi:hypothetical protein BaRGS_00036255 [Batillaria attramentaria]|uniref:Inosine/uridine-preferring nucleoside hydrolase domain-containing protein n=1 Tax=Batillaria attramentaria TaxID=370345 RepID=A0ABD0JBY8_9CAEN